MNYSKQDINYYYIDLNVIYAFFDWLSPKKIQNNKSDLKKRNESIINFISSNKPKDTKFLISKTIYIEWFQATIESIWNKNEHDSFNKFIKIDEYKNMLNKFKEVHKNIIEKDSIFEFEWNYEKFIPPKKQTWDHFHNSFKEKKEIKFITFDKKFSENKNDFIFLKR